MSEFKQYRRTQIAEMRPVTTEDIKAFLKDKHETPQSLRDIQFKVSISHTDEQNGSPKVGDMIARNPKNHADQWLVGKQFKHTNGNIYTVLMLTNIEGIPESIDSHPIDVVYIGQNGKMWSRRLSDWDRSFTNVL